MEIDPNPRLDHGDIARLELGHLAGMEHNPTTQMSAMSPHPLLDRYHLIDMLGMAAAGSRCRPWRTSGTSPGFEV